MIALTVRSPKTAQLICAVFALVSILCCIGAAQDLGAAETRPFTTFNVTIEIDIEDGEIDMMASFTLGAGSNSLDLSKVAVGLQVTGSSGAYSVAIPAGAFKADRSGAFMFQGSINRVKLEASIRPSRAGSYELELETEGANLKGFSNPVTVTLTVGDYSGSRSVRAKIE